jgi:TonB family protein
VEIDAENDAEEMAANARADAQIEDALFGPDGWSGLDLDAVASTRSLEERDAEHAQVGGGVGDEAAPLTLGQRLQVDWDGSDEKLRRGSESKLDDAGKGGKRGRGAPSQLGIPGVQNATVVPEERPLELQALVATRTHPLAPLAERIDRTLRANWTFPVEYKFMGFTGRTKAEFRVLPNGEVTDIRVIRRSGHPELDALAVDAIPKHIRNVTEPVPENGILLQFSFVYRNSPIAGSE